MSYHQNEQNCNINISIFKGVAKLRYVLENQHKKSEHLKLMECFLPSSLEYFVISLVRTEGDGKCYGDFLDIR
jgi:hypothetical protein